MTVDPDAENNTHAYALAMVGYNKSVLEVGCATGYFTEAMVERGCTVVGIELDPAAGDTLQLFPNYGWAFLGKPGWFDPAPLRAQAEGIWRDYQPRIPFGVVAVELPGLHTRLFEYPNVAAAHLQATCSIPLFLPSVRIDGKRYLDGGLFEKMPIWAAIEMGATRIIAIDSMPKIGKWFAERLAFASIFIHNLHRSFGDTKP